MPLPFFKFTKNYTDYEPLYGGAKLLKIRQKKLTKIDTDLNLGNKLIAHFMGHDIAILIALNENRYKSWDKLMPVIEKIETMDYGFKMCRKVVEVYVDSTKEVIIKRKESSRIESLWTATVDFIKLYNEIKC